MSALGIPESRVALAARLLVVGLLVCAATLVWRSPLSFVAFATVGAALSAGGVAFFLWAIVVQSGSRREGG